jgi:6-phosphogluconolactonase
MILQIVISSAVLIITLAFTSSLFVNEASMKDVSFFVGTYTRGESKGIYQYRLQADGTLKNIGLAASTENPSFLTKSANGKFLLAVNENGNDGGGGGTISSFSIINSELTFLDTKASGGAYPCFVSINPAGYVLAANYSSGNVGLLKLTPTGMLEGPLDVLQHTGQGTHQRQKEPHAHSAWFANNKDGIITVDLGTNELWFSTLNRNANTLVPDDPQKLAMASGSGPRHLAFHPNRNWFYVLNELNSTVTQVKKNSAGYMKLGETLSTLPDSFTGENLCADIRISRDGKFLYASNRGHNSISVYQIQKADGTLTLLGHEQVRGDWPRNFALSPDETHLLVANERSNNIVSFKRDKKTGALTFVHEIQAPNPVCLLF